MRSMIFKHYVRSRFSLGHPDFSKCQKASLQNVMLCARYFESSNIGTSLTLQDTLCFNVIKRMTYFLVARFSRNKKACPLIRTPRNSMPRIFEMKSGSFQAGKWNKYLFVFSALSLRPFELLGTFLSMKWINLRKNWQNSSLNECQR